MIMMIVNIIIRVEHARLGAPPSHHARAQKLDDEPADVTCYKPSSAIPLAEREGGESLVIDVTTHQILLLMVAVLICLHCCDDTITMHKCVHVNMCISCRQICVHTYALGGTYIACMRQYTVYFLLLLHSFECTGCSE